MAALDQELRGVEVAGVGIKLDEPLAGRVRPALEGFGPSASRFQKPILGVEDYFLNFKPWLVRDETVEGVRAWIWPDDAFIARVVFDELGVQVRIASGDAGIDHLVTVRTTTSTGRSKVTQFRVKTV